MLTPEGFSVTVVALEDRKPLPSYLDTALRVNQRYASQFGIQFRLFTGTAHLWTMPPFWARVALVADVHKQASAEEEDAQGFVVGLDSDAVFNSLSFDLRQELVELPRHKVLAVVREPPFRESGTRLSSGFFGVRLGAEGHALLQEWLAAYPAHLWRLERGRWRTDAPWAGNAYEQGQLNILARKHSKLVHEVPQWLLNSGFARPCTAQEGPEEVVLPGILHCTAWPGEAPEEHHERARAAFQEVQDTRALSNVSRQKLRTLEADEWERSEKLLGRVPREGDAETIAAPQEEKAEAEAIAESPVCAPQEEKAEAATTARPPVWDSID